MSKIKIAYLILAHKKPSQIIRLINKLNTHDNLFFIHYDKKSPKKEYNYLSRYFNNWKNVFFTKKRYKVSWAQFSMVHAMQELMKTSINSKKNFDYAIFISGEHYPIKKNQEIENCLRINKSFLYYFDIFEKVNKKEQPYAIAERIEKWHFKFLGKIIKFPPNNFPIVLKRRLLKGITFYKGNNWHILKKEHLIYTYNFSINNKKFYKFFKLTKHSDELYFNTILLNSKYKNDIINKSLVFVIWLKNTKHPGHPETILKKDFNTLKNSNELFARKFNPDIDSEILDLIDKKLLS